MCPLSNTLCRLLPLQDIWILQSVPGRDRAGAVFLLFVFLLGSVTSR